MSNVIHESEVLGYDADFSDERQYCRHGTWTGSWWGPDYLCHLCEMGVSDCDWCGVRDYGSDDPHGHEYVREVHLTLCEACLAKLQREHAESRFLVQRWSWRDESTREERVPFIFEWQTQRGAKTVGDAYVLMGEAITSDAKRGWYPHEFRIVDRERGDRVVYEHDPGDFAKDGEDEEVQA